MMKNKCYQYFPDLSNFVINIDIDNSNIMLYKIDNENMLKYFKSTFHYLFLIIYKFTSLYRHNNSLDISSKINHYFNFKY